VILNSKNISFLKQVLLLVFLSIASFSIFEKNSYNHSGGTMGGGFLRRELVDHTTLLGDLVCFPTFQARGG